MKITIIDGHPDNSKDRFCHAIATAYQQGAEKGGHEIKRINVADIEFPLLRTASDFESNTCSDVIKIAQDAIRWSDHLVII